VGSKCVCNLLLLGASKVIVLPCTLTVSIHTTRNTNSTDRLHTGHRLSVQNKFVYGAMTSLDMECSHEARIPSSNCCKGVDSKRAHSRVQMIPVGAQGQKMLGILDK
jgi:hypothetical protein